MYVDFLHRIEKNVIELLPPLDLKPGRKQSNALMTMLNHQAMPNSLACGMSERKVDLFYI